MVCRTYAYEEVISSKSNILTGYMPQLSATGMRAEAQLLRSQHPFLRIRLRLAAILYSVFMVSIVLLMDTCVNSPSSLHEEILDSDLAEALRIIEDARSHSLAAANLYESLMQIQAKHRTRQRQQKQEQQTPQPQVPVPLQQRSDPLLLGLSPTQVARDYLDGSGPPGTFLDQMSVPNSQLAPSLDNPMYLDNL